MSDNEWEESELIELIDALCAKCCLLRELRLADCGCSTPVVRHLCEVLTPKPDKCTPLGCLDVLGVGGASLTYMGLTYMAGWLRQAAALGTLDLSPCTNNVLDYYGVATIGEIIRQVSVLKSIVLLRLELTHAALQQLLSALKYRVHAFSSGAPSSAIIPLVTVGDTVSDPFAEEIRSINKKVSELMH